MRGNALELPEPIGVVVLSLIDVLNDVVVGEHILIHVVVDINAESTNGILSSGIEILNFFNDASTIALAIFFRRKEEGTTNKILRREGNWRGIGRSVGRTGCLPIMKRTWGRSRRWTQGLDEGVCLPTRRFDTEIGIIGRSGTDARSVDDLACIVGKDLECHSVPDGFGKTNKTATTFTGGGREIIVFQTVVHRLPKIEHEQHADVRGRSKNKRQGNRVDRRVPTMVQQETHVGQAKEPGEGGGTKAVHDGVGHGLDGIDASLSRVLVLMVGLTLPGRDEQGAKDILDSLTDFDLGTVTQKALHGTTLTDIVLKRVDEFLLGLHAVNVGNEGITANKDLGHGRSVSNGWSVGIDGVRSDIFRAAGDVEGRKGRTEKLLEVSAGRHTSVLRSLLEGLPDCVDRQVAKLRAEGFKVGRASGDRPKEHRNGVSPGGRRGRGRIIVRKMGKVGHP